MKINFLPALPSWLRARRSLAQAVMLAGLGSISLSLTSAGQLLSPELPQAVPCTRVAAQDDGCGAVLQLVFKTVTLPSGRKDQPYAPRAIARGGTPPYRVTVTEGQLPDGLKVDDGKLSGSPSAVGTFNFTLQITDASAASAAPLSVRQRYALRVDAPKAPGPSIAPASSQPAKSKPQSEVSIDDAKALTGRFAPAQIASYVLHKDDLGLAPSAVATVPDGSASAADGADQSAQLLQPAPPPSSLPKIALPIVADQAQLVEMLTPLFGVEYPTELLFKSALDARHCAYYVSVVTAAAKKQGGLPNTTCPPEKTNIQTPAPASTISLPALYDQLLSAEIKKVLVANAAQSHLLSEAKPVKWTSDGCGCLDIDKTQQSYMIYPFWQADGKAPQAIRFSNINRIGLLGVQLNDSGGYDAPRELLKGDENEAFINTAQRFGTKVDLVLHRSEWSTLLDLKLSEQERILERAAQEAVRLADVPKTDLLTKIKRFLLPGWGEPEYLYDGITVFFDSASIQPTTPESQEKFKNLHQSFIDKLISEMQKTRRSYQLSIVVPDKLIGTKGAYAFKQLMGYIEFAEQPDPSHPMSGGSKTRYRGITDIHVRFLVTLSEPTQDSKKKLRSIIDETRSIDGNRRITFLKSVIPIIFNSGTDLDTSATNAKSKQLELDLTYFSWQYGGVAFWPLPLADTPSGNVINDKLQESYSTSQSGNASKLFDAICPNRSALRLLFMGLLAIGGVAFISYIASCRVRDLGRAYVALLSILSVLIFVVGLMLLYFDPRLESLKEGNWPLVIFGSVVLVGALWRALQTREKPP